MSARHLASLLASEISSDMFASMSSQSGSIVTFPKNISVYPQYDDFCSQYCILWIFCIHAKLQLTHSLTQSCTWIVVKPEPQSQIIIDSSTSLQMRHLYYVLILQLNHVLSPPNGLTCVSFLMLSTQDNSWQPSLPGIRLPPTWQLT